MHDIVCFLNYFSQGEGTYRNKIMGKAEAIRRFDQKDLQDFLNGKINTCDKINWGALEAQAAERMTSLPTYAASYVSKQFFTFHLFLIFATAMFLFQ